MKKTLGSEFGDSARNFQSGSKMAEMVEEHAMEVYIKEVNWWSTIVTAASEEDAKVKAEKELGLGLDSFSLPNDEVRVDGKMRFRLRRLRDAVPALGAVRRQQLQQAI